MIDPDLNLSDFNLFDFWGAAGKPAFSDFTASALNSSTVAPLRPRRLGVVQEPFTRRLCPKVGSDICPARCAAILKSTPPSFAKPEVRAYTPLVQEPVLSDFSTAAVNSDLIIRNEIPATPKRCAMQKNNNEVS
jgi:hypothetical protein